MVGRNDRDHGALPWRGRRRATTLAPLTAILAVAPLVLLVLLPLPGLSAEDSTPQTSPESPDQTAGPPIEGLFDLYIGGLRAAEMTVTASFKEGRYKAAARIATAGMIGGVFKASIDAAVEGRLIGEPFVTDRPWFEPERYRSESLNPRQDRRVAMDFLAGAPSVSAEPAYDPRPWELDPSSQEDSLDPISGIVAGLSPASRGTLCNREIVIFDARRRYAVRLDAPSTRNSDGEIICEAEYRRVAGFKPKLLKRPPFPFRTVFLERADGLWAFERAMGETPIGTAVLRRRR